MVRLNKCLASSHQHFKKLTQTDIRLTICCSIEVVAWGAPNAGGAAEELTGVIKASDMIADRVCIAALAERNWE